MIKKTLLLIVVVVAAILGYATTKPDTFSVQREITIKAPPEKIAGLITDFHYWAAWSPWEKLDPAMRRTFAGPANGLGAQYAWQGNDKVGAGRMEITEAAQPERTVIKLDFLKPFESHNTTTFTMTPRHQGELDHDGPQPLRQQGHDGVCQHGQDDRQGF